jgi:UDP-2,3-diacylglucosamine hydrolase
MTRASVYELTLSNSQRGWCAISDLHLSEHMPETMAKFEWFCAHIAPQYDALFILGDLFEYWVGDDAADFNPTALRVIEAIHTLKSRGTQSYFMRGNRDIAMERAYCERADMILLPDPCVLTDGEQRIILSHGDLLCTDDHEYQRQRRFYTHPCVKKIILKAPLSWRVKLVQYLREKSRRRWLNTPEHLRKQRTIEQNVTESAVQQWREQYNATTLLHGHTHRPGEHADGGFTRWVLPDWDLDNSPHRWGYMSARHQQFELITHIHSD